MFKRKPRTDLCRDEMGRFCGDPDMPTMPAVFTGVMASPEAEAEFEELEQYKLTPDEPFNYWILRLRKARKFAKPGI